MSRTHETLHEIRVLYDQKAPVRDGVRLSAEVCLPKALGPLTLPLMAAVCISTNVDITQDGSALLFNNTRVMRQLPIIETALHSPACPSHILLPVVPR
jgi:predicted acyl esterase